MSVASYASMIPLSRSTYSAMKSRLLWMKLMGLFKVQGWIFRNLFLTWAAPINASLAYAIAFILLWLFLMWLLYRKNIFIKV